MFQYHDQNKYDDAWVKEDIFSSMKKILQVQECFPVKIVALLEAQIEFVTLAFVNNTPFLAILSILGVEMRRLS